MVDPIAANAALENPPESCLELLSRLQWIETQIANRAYQESPHKSSLDISNLSRRNVGGFSTFAPTDDDIKAIGEGGRWTLDANRAGFRTLERFLPQFFHKLNLPVPSKFEFAIQSMPEVEDFWVRHSTLVLDAAFERKELPREWIPRTHPMRTNRKIYPGFPIRFPHDLKQWLDYWLARPTSGERSCNLDDFVRELRNFRLACNAWNLPGYPNEERDPSNIESAEDRLRGAIDWLSNEDADDTSLSEDHRYAPHESGADAQKKTAREISVIKGTKDPLTRALLIERLDDPENSKRTIGEIQLDFAKTYKKQLGKNDIERAAEMKRVERNVRRRLQKLEEQRD